MEDARILRVVVASPSDVKPERDALKEIIEEVNRLAAKDRGVRLELLRWEDDAYAGFHIDGPQGLIDAILRIPECDLCQLSYSVHGRRTAPRDRSQSQSVAYAVAGGGRAI